MVFAAAWVVGNSAMAGGAAGVAFPAEPIIAISNRGMVEEERFMVLLFQVLFGGMP